MACVSCTHHACVETQCERKKRLCDTANVGNTSSIPRRIPGQASPRLHHRPYAGPGAMAMSPPWSPPPPTGPPLACSGAWHRGQATWPSTYSLRELRDEDGRRVSAMRAGTWGKPPHSACLNSAVPSHTMPVPRLCPQVRHLTADRVPRRCPEDTHTPLRISAARRRSASSVGSRGCKGRRVDHSRIHAHVECPGS